MAAVAAEGSEGLFFWRRKEVKDFSADEFAEWLRRECTGPGWEVDLYDKGLTDESMGQLAKGLLKVFLGSPGDEHDDGDDEDEDDSSLMLKKLYLGGSNFGGDGLRALAEVLSPLPRCRETLERLSIGVTQEVTTLAPLADAGVLGGLKVLYANNCSLSGDEGVLPPELCANLPALEELDLRHNEGSATVTLTAEALCALPAECKVKLDYSKVQVARPSAEDGEMGLVALLTADGEEFGANNAKTVAEICAFAGVQPVTLVKPVRA
jgi:hypothetical protein